ncbi:family 16 glycosylhydrolase [Nonomuraea typhae]|uniref:family 16 glycosylhydrolase n=1 Tax=Nonomuraea typhae TaxID=2603600 RepID=UPI0012F93DB1|nr:family 16 glycosylhydrolase [Nonomuraea typhae]
MRLLTALLLLCALAACSGPERREVFRDDFDGTTLDAGRWRHETGPPERWGTGEIETMAAANAALDGKGNLAITPLSDGGRWTSGRVRTQRADFAVPPGGTLRVEARIALPAVTPADGAGYWPAFWMLGGETGWPAVGEIDIMEAVNGRPAITGAMHCGTMPGGPCREPKGLVTPERACPDCFGAFHTYAVEVTERATTWFLDGRPYHTLERSLPRGFFVILNVAIGGGLPGPPNAATVPGRPMLVDWVSVRTTG